MAIFFRFLFVIESWNIVMKMDKFKTKPKIILWTEVDLVNLIQITKILWIR